MQNIKAFTMDYLNDGDSICVDSKVTWFWQSSAVTLQIHQIFRWSWWSALAGGRGGAVSEL